MIIALGFLIELADLLENGTRDIIRTINPVESIFQNQYYENGHDGIYSPYKKMFKKFPKHIHYTFCRRGDRSKYYSEFYHSSGIYQSDAAEIYSTVSSEDRFTAFLNRMRIEDDNWKRSRRKNYS